MRSIVVGMGIGSLYKTVLENLNYDVITVDLVKPADFKTVDDAIRAYSFFDTAHICTPNFTHETIARQLADCARLIFVEKPGVKDANTWMSIVTDFPKTRFMMVKNNQWRSNLDEMRQLALQSTTININWINHNRVPNPGSWFTTKELSYGGVSRDLMPHLLSLFAALEPNYFAASQDRNLKIQRWKLDQLSGTDYGAINIDGVYDVDDVHLLRFLHNDKIWNLTANWRSMDSTNVDIEFKLNDGSTTVIQLGLCPEDAYQSMIDDAVCNQHNDKFWYSQFIQDYWIHGVIA